MNQINRYINSVLSGTRVVGRYERLAVLRFVEDQKRDDLVFDQSVLDRFIKFTKLCHHWKGTLAGKPIVLEDWQVFYVGNILAWKFKATGLRRFRRTYLEVARKNGKTTILALISLYLLVMDGEQGSQIFAGATKEDQARILVNDAGMIIGKSPALKDKFTTFKYQNQIKRVVYPPSSAFIAPLGRDSDSQDGFDPAVGNIDEFHEHKTSDLLNVIVSGMGARRQPLLNIITTAGFNKDYPCFQVTRKTGIEILEGAKQDDSYFVLIFTIDDLDDWTDPAMWVKSNPNLGVSVRTDFLQAEFQTAMNEGGRTEVNFKTKHLNIWTDAPEVWIRDEVWMLCDRGAEDVSGQSCYGGIDLGKTLDMNAFVLLFDSGVVKCWFWLPEQTIKNADNDQYNAWLKAGLLKSIPGQVIRPEVIAADIIEIGKKYNIKSIAYDPYIATHGTVQALDDANFILSPLAQGIRTLSAHTKVFERMVYDKELNHEGHPILRWMMSNVVIDVDSNGNIKINKQKSGNKIDGIAALINAIAQRTDFKDMSSIYNTQELRVI